MCVLFPNSIKKKQRMKPLKWLSQHMRTASYEPGKLNQRIGLRQPGEPASFRFRPAGSKYRSCCCYYCSVLPRRPGSLGQVLRCFSRRSEPASRRRSTDEMHGCVNTYADRHRTWRIHKTCIKTYVHAKIFSWFWFFSIAILAPAACCWLLPCERSIFCAFL